MINKLNKDDIKNILLKRSLNDKIKSLKDLPDPFVFKDMKKSCNRIKRAIKNQEQIVIIGDYDVDGVVSSVIMAEFFNFIGKSIKVIIPDRFKDGYGISKQIVDNIEADLIITVDNGISAIEASKACKNKNIDLIITDHHSLPNTLPQAYSIVNQKQKDCKFPEDEICGATIAWYIVAGMKKIMNLNINLKDYLDILSIAIIADLMPIKSINKVLVKSGLKQFNNTKREALLTIKRRLNKTEIDSMDIAFNIAPKINSAGRIDNAMLAFDFLLQKDMQKSSILYDKLNSLNELRKTIQQDIFETTIKDVDENKNIILSYSKEYNEGVIGIVASKLVDRFKKPAIVFCKKQNILKGSARSIDNINIYEIINKAKDYLIGFGGHKGAAGLSLEFDNFDNFKNLIEKELDKYDKHLVLDNIFGYIDLDIVDLDIVNLLQAFEPYGKDNEYPIFQANNLQIKNIVSIGEQKQHIKLKLMQKNGKKIVDAVIFFTKNRFTVGDIVKCKFVIKKNIYNNHIFPQLILTDIKDC